MTFCLSPYPSSRRPSHGGSRVCAVLLCNDTLFEVLDHRLKQILPAFLHFPHHFRLYVAVAETMLQYFQKTKSKLFQFLLSHMILFFMVSDQLLERCRLITIIEI